MSNSSIESHIEALPSTRFSRTFRQRLVPISIWALSIVLFFVLIREQTGYQFAIGIVEVNEVIVSPLGDGTIRSLSVDLFDSIEAGDVVAMMDDTLIVADLAIEEAQLGQIRAELDVERKRLENSTELDAVQEMDSLRRYQLNEEQARLEFLELSVDVEADRVKLERYKIQMERQEQLVNEAIGDMSSYDDSRLRYEELKQEIESQEQALLLAQGNVDETTQRRMAREGQSSGSTPNTLLYLEPYLQRLKVQEARREEIQQERLTLALRAPISGQIAKVFYRPGETILSGKTLLSIQSTTSNRVIAYVDERSAMNIVSGTVVQLRSAARPQIVATAKVLRAGSSMEELPERIWATPIFGEWGFPVLIGDVPDGVFLPGETVKVRFEV